MPLTVDAHHSRLLRLHALNFSTAHDASVPAFNRYIYIHKINKHLFLRPLIYHPQQLSLVLAETMRLIFLMAAAMATTTALALLLTVPVVVATTRSLGRRSRFLATLDSISCTDEAPCPDIVDPVYGLPIAGAECCDGVCVDTSFNANRCGGCDPRHYACGSWPWICCYGYCFNSLKDAENCGHCGNTCWEGGCFNGVCGYAV